MRHTRYSTTLLLLLSVGCVREKPQTQPSPDAATPPAATTPATSQPAPVAETSKTPPPKTPESAKANEPEKAKAAPPSTAKTEPASTGKTAKTEPAPAGKTEPAATSTAAPKAQATAKTAQTKPAPTGKTPAAAKTPAATAKPPAAQTASAPAGATTASTAATLDLEALKTELKQTKAIGVFTKLSLKNKVDDLLEKFREHHAGKPTPTLSELRSSYDLLLMKVLSLLQDSDQRLASEIVSSREKIWGMLADPKKFAALPV